jgi:hypothetical protein
MRVIMFVARVLAAWHMFAAAQPRRLRHPNCGFHLLAREPLPRLAAPGQAAADLSSRFAASAFRAGWAGGVQFGVRQSDFKQVVALRAAIIV